MVRSCKEITDMLHHLADAAADVILSKFRASTPIEDKGVGRFDPVTAADRGAEAAIRKILKTQRPDDGIIGEEYGAERTDAEHVWVIDPIDGTRAFIQGLPTWGILIGLLYRGQPYAGMMCQPYIGERFWSNGERAYFRGLGTQTAALAGRASTLANAQLATTDPYLFTEPEEKTAFEALRQKVRGCRFGTDCYGYSMVAAGQVDIVLETGLQPYDIVALVPLVEHAGGRVTSWDGGEAHNGGRILACGDPELHADVIEFLQQLPTLSGKSQPIDQSLRQY